MDDDGKPKLRRDFLIERSGKQFVLYAGLLDLAHASGLRCIETEPMQFPTDENKQVAIVKARVVLAPLPGETEPRVYHGLGESSPRSVPGPMKEALIRFAETRAKARALRDAINVAVVALEELDEEPETAPASVQRPQEVQSQPARVTAPAGNGNGHAKAAPAPREPAPAPTGPATEAQMRGIFAVAKSRLQWGEGEVRAAVKLRYQHESLKDLTLAQASDLLGWLQSEDAKEPVPF